MMITIYKTQKFYNIFGKSNSKNLISYVAKQFPTVVSCECVCTHTCGGEGRVSVCIKLVSGA